MDDRVGSGKWIGVSVEWIEPLRNWNWLFTNRMRNQKSFDKLSETIRGVLGNQASQFDQQEKEMTTMKDAKIVCKT